MSSNKHESAAERLARMKQEREAVKDQGGTEELVSQLTHESTGEPNFADIAKKLKDRQEAEKAPSALDDTVKFTIYVDKAIAEAFKALCIERGDQRRFATQAFADFVSKKVKELGL